MNVIVACSIEFYCISDFKVHIFQVYINFHVCQDIQITINSENASFFYTV